VVADDLVIIYIIVFHLVEGAYYLQVVIQLTVFWNRRQSRRVVLLVVSNDMGHEGALTRQEPCACFQSLSVPHFGLVLLQLLFALDLVAAVLGVADDLFLCDIIVEEPELCTNAEVGDCEQDDLLQDGISTQLVRVVDVEVHLFSAEWLQVHHVADIQVKDPVVFFLSYEESSYVPPQVEVVGVFKHARGFTRRLRYFK